MAFVAKPQISIIFTVRDNDGKSSTAEVQIAGATLPAAAVTFATALRALLAPLLDGIITGQSVIIGAYEDAVGVIPRSDVEDKGLFNFFTSTGQRSSIALPSIKESVLQANNQDIDGTNADVAAFVNAMTLGLAGTQPAGAGGSDITGVASSYKQNRRSMLGRQSRVRKG
jgi:hypothetical protein